MLRVRCVIPLLLCTYLDGLASPAAKPSDACLSCCCEQNGGEQWHTPAATEAGPAKPSMNLV